MILLGIQLFRESKNRPAKLAGRLQFKSDMI